MAGLTLTVRGLVVPVSSPVVEERMSQALLLASAAAVQEMGRAQLPDSLMVTVCACAFGGVKARLVGETPSWHGCGGCATLRETEKAWGPMPKSAGAPALSVVMVTWAV